MKPPRKPAAAQTTRRRWVGILLALALVAAVQLGSAGDLSGPFLDTRLHVDYDNALFSFMARNGLRNGEARSQWGVTVNDYVAWGERAGPPRYYTDHPFLVKAAFQQFARLAGTGEASSRTFYLIVSLSAAAGLFTLLLQTTRAITPALVGALALVSLPVFSKFQTCVKFELDGMLLAVWLLAALAWFERDRGRGRLAVVAGLVVGCVLAHWTSLLVAGFVGLALLLEAWRRPGRARWLAFGVPAAAGAGALVVLASLMAWLQGSWQGAWHALVLASARRAGVASFTWSQWLGRQGTYAVDNFGVPFLAAIGIVAVALVALSVRRGRVGSSTTREAQPWALGVAMFALTAAALVWLLAFRQGSYVHSFWQLPLTLPAALLVGIAVAAARQDRRWSLAALVGAAALVAQLNVAGIAARREAAAARLGTPADVEFLASLRDDRSSRLVYVPVARHPLDEWFQGPLFEYYTDRPVVVAQPGWRPRPDDRVLLLRYKDRDTVVGDVGIRLGARLVDERCGARLCAYSVIPR
ncbi:MAG: hypothetical protein HY825_16500 [Acidobacteria bacterium]|nr:hypothetical protein [Acidobacteriota bacterium]